MATESPSVHIRLKAATPVHLRGAHNVVLSIPQASGRKALRKLVHHLLSSSNDSPEDEQEKLPEFQFLINGEPLRTTLEKFIERRNISIENTIEVIYYLPISEPRKQKSIAVQSSEEWLSNLSIYLDNEQFHILTSSYSGISSYYTYNIANNDIEYINKFQCHKSITKDIHWLYKNKTVFATVSNDENCILWNNKFEQLGIFHTQDCGQPVGLNCIDVNKSNDNIVVGSENGLIWHLPNINEIITKSNDNNNNHTSKRKQLDIPSIPVIKIGNGSPNLPTTCVKYLNPNPNLIASTGFDSMIRIWDIETNSENVIIPTGNKPLYNMDFQNNIFITASVDGAVRLVDSKNNKGVIAACGKKHCHNGIVTDVSWLNETNINQFVSSGYDGSIRVWDVRAMLSPVRTVQDVHGERKQCFTVETASESSDRQWIFSTGADGKVASLTIP